MLIKARIVVEVAVPVQVKTKDQEEAAAKREIL
jgi:hypothetical protein